MLFTKRIFNKRVNIVLGKNNDRSIKHMTFASKQGYLNVAKYLHSIEAPIDEWAIAWASENGQLDVVKYLCFIDAHINEWAIVCASDKGHVDIIRFLKKQYHQFQ